MDANSLAVKLQRLHDQATPGVWAVNDSLDEGGGATIGSTAMLSLSWIRVVDCTQVSIAANGRVVTRRISRRRRDADARFIADVRNLMPAIINALREMPEGKQ
jgi:hypothetical protein